MVFHPGPPSGNDEKSSWSPEGLPYFHAKENDNIANHAAWYAFDYNDNQLVDGSIADNAVNIFYFIDKKRTKQMVIFFLAVGFHKPHISFKACMILLWKSFM